MKKATQPNGIELDARELLERLAELGREVGDARLVEPPAAPDQPRPGAGVVGRLAAEVERPDPEEGPVGPVGERLLVDVERRPPSPGRSRTARGRPAGVDRPS